MTEVTSGVENKYHCGSLEISLSLWWGSNFLDLLCSVLLLCFFFLSSVFFVYDDVVSLNLLMRLEYHCYHMTERTVTFTRTNILPRYYQTRKKISQKYWTLRKIQNEKNLIKWQDQKLKLIKRIDNIGHIPDLVHIYVQR